MNPRTWIVSLAMSMLAGCSSLVDGPCGEGYRLQGNACVEGLGPDATDLATDGGLPDGVISVADSAPGDGPPGDGPGDGPASGDGPVPLDGPTCSAPSLTCGGTCTDVTTDAQNCGACGRRCASGICQAGQCAGDLDGHIVAIGHDYQSHNAAMARVLGNSAALAGTSDLGIARISGTAATASKHGVTSALTSSLASLGRASHVVALPAVGQPLTGIDVLVIDAQTGDGDAAQALGAAWASAIDGLLARAGVVIVVEGANGVSHRFASGANLFTVATPIETTGSPAFVAAANDAIVQQVVSPYLADTTSVVFPSVVGAIATPSGTVVMHLTR